MKKIIFTTTILILALIVIAIAMRQSAPAAQPLIPVPEPVAFDPEQATYTIDGNAYPIRDGIGRTPAATGQAASGSTNMIITRYFGNQATGDLNNDRIPDYAYLITQEPGGSGTFYYVVAALSDASSTNFNITPTVLLGDRIAPQTTEIKDGKMYVQYADRASGEPMSVQPSVGVTKVFQVDASAKLVEVK